MKLRQGDTVEILKDVTGCGDRNWPKGRRGKVLMVLRDSDRVVVEGVRFIYRHVRRSRQHPRGARVEKEAPLHVSNVALVCPACLEKTRVGYRFLLEGGKKKNHETKVRFCKKCNQNIDQE